MDLQYSPAAPDNPHKGGLRLRAPLSRLKITDPALRAMVDFQHEPTAVLTEEITLDAATDWMFRLGVHALPVVRGGTVVGLIGSREAREYGAQRRTNGASTPRVGDVMTPADQMPTIGLETLRGSRILDLVEIFEATGVAHLVVLEDRQMMEETVRGVIHRRQLQRQLGTAVTLSNLAPQPVIQAHWAPQITPASSSSLPIWKRCIDQTRIWHSWGSP